MVRCFRELAVVSLCVVVTLLVASPVNGQDKVKLTGAELQNLILKPGVVRVGFGPKTNTAWIMLHQAEGKGDLYWRSVANPAIWGLDVGTIKVVGDQQCIKWSTAPEACGDIYRTGENQYQTWVGGEVAGLWRIAPEASGESGKDKVKITGAELQEFVSRLGIAAGVNYIEKNIWIMESVAPEKRIAHWRSLATPGVSGAFEATVRIVGDQSCLKFPWGQEKCYDHYRIGEDRYQTWFQGQLESSFYRLK